MTLNCLFEGLIYVIILLHRAKHKIIIVLEMFLNPLIIHGMQLFTDFNSTINYITLYFKYILE